MQNNMTRVGFKCTTPDFLCLNSYLLIYRCKILIEPEPSQPQKSHLCSVNVAKKICSTFWHLHWNLQKGKDFSIQGRILQLLFVRVESKLEKKQDFESQFGDLREITQTDKHWPSAPNFFKPFYSTLNSLAKEGPSTKRSFLQGSRRTSTCNV